MSTSGLPSNFNNNANYNYLVSKPKTVEDLPIIEQRIYQVFKDLTASNSFENYVRFRIEDQGESDPQKLLEQLEDIRKEGLISLSVKEIKDSNHPLYPLFQHVFHTKDYCLSGDETVFIPLDLHECNCIATGSFDRLMNPRRDRLENAIVNKLAELHPDKNQPLKLVSLGSGGLMSDFIILEKLVLCGFKNIEIDCIDPMFEEPDQKLEKIRGFFNAYPDISLKIDWYHRILQNEYYSEDQKIVPSEKSDYDAVLAVDFDAFTAAYEDLVFARYKLKDEGFVALGMKNSDVISGPNSPPINLFKVDSMAEIFASDIETQINALRKGEGTVSVFISNNLSGVDRSLVGYALAVAIEKFPDQRFSIAGNNDIIQMFKPIINDKKRDISLVEETDPRLVMDISFYSTNDQHGNFPSKTEVGYYMLEDDVKRMKRGTIETILTHETLEGYICSEAAASSNPHLYESQAKPKTENDFTETEKILYDLCKQRGLKFSPLEFLEFLADNDIKTPEKLLSMIDYD